MTSTRPKPGSLRRHSTSRGWIVSTGSAFKITILLQFSDRIVTQSETLICPSSPSNRKCDSATSRRFDDEKSRISSRRTAVPHPTCCAWRAPNASPHRVRCKADTTQTQRNVTAARTAYCSVLPNYFTTARRDAVACRPSGRRRASAPGLAAGAAARDRFSACQTGWRQPVRRRRRRGEAGKGGGGGQVRLRVTSKGLPSRAGGRLSA